MYLLPVRMKKIPSEMKALERSQHISHGKSMGIFSNTQRLSEKGPAPPPLGNFADKVYLKEQYFLIQMRDVCTLYAGA